MVAQYYFNFETFISTMDVSTTDETTYSFILRTIFSYINKIYGIDVEANTTSTPSGTPIESSFTIPYSEVYTSGLLVVSGTEYAEVTDVVNDDLLTTSTITISPSFSSPPLSVTVYTTKVTFDLQYAIFLHAKYLFESQKKNTYIIDSASDSGGNRVTYKPTPPSIVKGIYLEYSSNEIAFI